MASQNVVFGVTRKIIVVGVKRHYNLGFVVTREIFVVRAKNVLECSLWGDRRNIYG